MSMMSPHFRRLVICGLVLTAWGCATPTGLVQVYEGPQRPENEIVTLIMPAALEVLAVDGEEIKIPYFGGSDYKLQLLPGPHTLELFYKESWGGPTASGVVVSDVSMFRFTAQAGAVYTAQHDGPKNLVTASRFSESQGSGCLIQVRAGVCNPTQPRSIYRRYFARCVNTKQATKLLLPRRRRYPLRRRPRSRILR